MDTLLYAIDDLLRLDEKAEGRMAQALFFVPFAAWVAARLLLTKTAYASIAPFDYQGIRVACLCVLVLREVLFGKWDRLTLIGFSLFAFMAAMAWCGRMEVVFDSIVIVFCGRSIDFRKLAMLAFAELCAILLVTVLPSLLGIIPDVIVWPRSRHMLGFFHPNNGPVLAFFALCAWVYLRGTRFCWRDALASSGIILALFILTDSRTTMLASALLIGGVLLSKRVPRSVFRLPAVKVLGVGSVAICAFLGIAGALAFNADAPLSSFLNGLLSGRMQLGHDALAQLGVHLLYDPTGQASGMILDCAYVFSLANFGVLFFAVGLALATFAAFGAYEREERALVLVIAVIALFGLSEANVLYLTQDVFLFLLARPFDGSGVSRLNARMARAYQGRHAK